MYVKVYEKLKLIGLEACKYVVSGGRIDHVLLIINVLILHFIMETF